MPGSYDLKFIDAKNNETTFNFGKQGGIQLGNSLKEPSLPGRIDSIVLESMHHGAGRLLATDPLGYRDTNGQPIGADARQPGFVMPGGYLQKIATIPFVGGPTALNHEGYAASFINEDGELVFAVGKQFITINPSNDQVTSTSPLGAFAPARYFTGSHFEWVGDHWLGVMTVGRDSAGAYSYNDSNLVTDASFEHSWAVSTRNSLFWLRNRASDPPQMRWTDRTDTAFDDIDDTPDTGFVYGPFDLEIPQGRVTGIGSAGPYPVWASRGGNLWGFDPSEVFMPLSPDNGGGFRDELFAGPIANVGTWMLIPNADGLHRFDPRTLTMVDITPSAHQGTAPTFNSGPSRRCDCAATTPTGALVIMPFTSQDSLDVLLLEMYEDGMYYHVAYEGLPLTRAWGATVTREQIHNEVTSSQLRAYIVGSDASESNWEVYRLDIPASGWQPGPANLAPTSGLRTAMHTARPPDVSVIPTQVRGYAQASAQNIITLGLEIDGEELELGVLDRTGSFVLPLPGDVVPGRRFAITTTFSISDNAGTVPFLVMPLSIDYMYTPKAAEGEPDLVTLRFEASSDYVDRWMGFNFGSGAGRSDYAVGSQGEVIEVHFGDREKGWKVAVIEASAELVEQEQGVVSTSYLCSLVCKRIL